ncbi:MAG: TIGR00730 family Rossman fold protein [Alphaproteobacteria bacterium]|nr:TIGR00730 family Rossman fold protein [Alphaproteobacteria bacterium]
MHFDSVCVFCGAQRAVATEHLELANRFGANLAKNNRKLVYGGGDCGLMGEVANGALNGKGYVIGVFPRHLNRIEVEHKGLSRMFLVDSMHERKFIMYQNSDVFVILPGGFGTLDEMFEVITWRQIELHTKPVIIFNHNGYWTKLIELMEHIINEKFAKPNTRDFFQVVNTEAELYDLLGMKV